MKTYPGNDWTELNENTPWNVMDNETLNKDLADRGSSPSALSATMLVNFANEDNETLMSCIDVNGASTYDNRHIWHCEADMDSVLAIFGASVYMGSTYKFDYTANHRWHKMRLQKGLYKNNAPIGGASPDNLNIQLTELTSLIDDDYSTASVSAISDSNINVGVQVGSEEYGNIYKNVVDALVIVSDTTGLAGWELYTSDDNRTWTAATKSSYSLNGWSNGEYSVSNFRGSGVNARIIKLANPVSCNYLKGVLPTAAAAWNLYEVLALNLQGELRFSSDLNNWRAPARNTSYTDYLLFRFEDVYNEVRAVEYYLDAFDPASTKAARIDLDHMEIYADPRAVDFGSDGLERIVTITTGTLGTYGTGQEQYVRNNDSYNRTASKVYAHIPLAPRAVNNLAVTAGGTTFQLTDSTNRVTYCRYILNSDNTDLGSSADTSVSVAGGIALWTEVAAAPAGNQYAIDYNTGIMTTGNAIPANSTISFTYANPGAASIEIANTNSHASFVGPGYVNRIELASTNVLPTKTAYYYIRSQLTNFTETDEDLIRTGLVLVEMLFKGSRSSS